MSDEHTPNADDKLEDYFFDLLISKKATDKEIQDLIDVVDVSHIHLSYKLAIKRVLFGKNNLFIQNWGTLQSSLLDIARNDALRDNDITTHGVILELLFKMIEYIFDVDDEHMMAFVMSEKKEDIQNSIIILMKKVLDYFEEGLRELIKNTIALNQVYNKEQPSSEFIAIKNTLIRYPEEILLTQTDRMQKLKMQIDMIEVQIGQQKNII